MNEAQWRKATWSFRSVDQEHLLRLPSPPPGRRLSTLLTAGSVLTALRRAQLILAKTLWDRHFIYSHFMDVETEAQGKLSNLPRVPWLIISGEILNPSVWLWNLNFFLTTQRYRLMHQYFIVVLVNCCFRYHTLRGTYGVADLQTLSSSDMLATSLQGNFLRLAKKDGVRVHCNLFV